jgi:hypothetical protein
MGRKFNPSDVKKQIELAPHRIAPSPNGDAWVHVQGREISLPDLGDHPRQDEGKSPRRFSETVARRRHARPFDVRNDRRRKTPAHRGALGALHLE